MATHLEQKIWGSARATKFRILGSGAELHKHGRVMCDTRRKRPWQARGKRLQKAGRRLTGVTQVTWEMRAWGDEELETDVHRRLGLGKKTPRGNLRVEGRL